jgi:predicted transposase/invertase (TIGR01784 family)
MTRFINPYTDFGFKKLFGEEANKDLLIDFLNAVLPLESPIASLTFRNSEQLPDNAVDRKAVFDIACVGANGESFSVEMQKAKQLWFKDRALFYTIFPILRQAQQGNWNFKLNPVYLVAVLDFKYDEMEERQKLYRLVSYKDQDGEEFTDRVKMVFLQMPLFTLQEHELRTPKDKWLFFLKNLESFEEIPSILREPVFEKAFATAEYVNYSPALQEAYQNDLKAYRDNINVLETAKIESEAKGRAEEKLEIARSMKKENLDVALIAKVTGLLLEEIERLEYKTADGSLQQTRGGSVARRSPSGG